MATEHDVTIEMADILIVDDESANLKLLSDILGREGFRVRPANSPRLAIDSALGKPPDLILLDIRMPDMEGFEVCELLKKDERTRDTPILFISALQDSKDKVRAFEAGGLDFVTKPFQEEEVLARVRTHLKLRNMQLNLEQLVAERTAALSRSEHLARKLLDATTDLTHLIDEDGTILDLNDAMAARLGGKREDLLGRCVFDLFPQEASEARREVARRVLSEGRPLRYVDRHGGDMVLDTGIYPVETPSGERNQLVIFAHDITESERTLRELQASEARYRRLVENVPDVIWTTDATGKTIFISEGVQESFGFSQEEVYALSNLWIERIHPDDADRVQQGFARLFETGTMFDVEYRIRHKDGHWVWLHDRSMSIYQKDGVSYADGLYSDVSFRKEAELELQRSEARLREAQRMAKIGSWEVDVSTRALIWSDEVLRIFEIDPERFDGRLETLFGVIHPDDREMVEQAHRRSSEECRSQRIEHRLVMRDGRIKYVRGHWETVCSGEGRPQRVVKTVQDITEHVRAEKEGAELRIQLAHLGRATILNELAASLAHEISQPLGAILRNAEAASLLLGRDPADLEEVADIVADIQGDVNRASAVIGGMRNLVKRREMEFDALSVDDLVDRVVDLVKAEVQGRGSRLDVRVPAGLPLVRGDVVHLQQVLINLILNGLDAVGDRPGDKQIEVLARLADPETVEVAVSDRGAGISAEAQPRLFAPLFTTKSSGLGMGLSIAKRCIEAHEGRIWAENNRTGGATFRFTLKVARGRPE